MFQKFYIILHHLKKLKQFFKRYIIINEDYRNIKTIELSMETQSNLSLYDSPQHYLLGATAFPPAEQQLSHN